MFLLDCILCRYRIPGSPSAILLPVLSGTRYPNAFVNCFPFLSCSIVAKLAYLLASSLNVALLGTVFTFATLSFRIFPSRRGCLLQ